MKTPVIAEPIGDDVTTWIENRSIDGLSTGFYWIASESNGAPSSARSSSSSSSAMEEKKKLGTIKRIDFDQPSTTSSYRPRKAANDVINELMANGEPVNDVINKLMANGEP